MVGNSHITAALLVAPLLALLAWFAVGGLVGERAQPAQAGQSYPLVARSNCRYASSRCDLENADLRVSLRYDANGPGALVLESSHPLNSVLISVADASADSAPRHMQPLDAEGLRWRFPLARRPGADRELRLVASAAGARYFAATSVAFLQPEA